MSVQYDELDGSYFGGLEVLVGSNVTSVEIGIIFNRYLGLLLMSNFLFVNIYAIRARRIVILVVWIRLQQGLWTPTYLRTVLEFTLESRWTRFGKQRVQAQAHIPTYCK